MRRSSPIPVGFGQVIRFLTPVIFPDDEYRTFTFRVLHYTLQMLITIGLVFTVFASSPTQLTFIPVLVLLLTICYYWLHTNRFQLASGAFLGGLWLIITIAAFSLNGILNAGVSAYAIIIIYAAILFSDRAVILATGLSILSGIALVLGENLGLLPLRTTPLFIADRFFQLIALLASTGILLLAASRVIRKSIAQSRQAEQILLERNRELKNEISERQKAEQALRESEKQYRAISELISDYAYASDIYPDGTFTSVWITDDSFTRMTGYQWSEIGASFNLYHPDDAETARLHVEQTIRGQATSGEYRIVTKSGDIRWIAIRRRVEWDEHKQRPVRFYGAAQDITERKEAEQALQQLSDAAVEGIGMSCDGQIIMANKRLAEMVGYEYQELIGKSVIDLVSPEFRDRVQAYMQSDHQDVYEYSSIRKDGSQFPVEAQGKTISFQGRPVRVVSIRDITERKRAELLLRESEERFRAIAESSPIAIIITEYSDEGRLLYANSIFSKLYGYDPTTTSVITVNDLYYQVADRELLLAELREKGQLKNYDVRGISGDGSSIWLSLTMMPIHYDGQEALITAVLDISERKRAEAALQRSETFLRALLDATTDVAFLMSQDGKFLTLNKTLADSWKTTVEALVGEKVFDHSRGKSRDERLRRFEMVRQSGQPTRWEDTGSNDNAWWDNNIYPVLSSDGKIDAFAVYSRNITEEKRLQLELQKYAKQLELMVEERTAQLRRTKEQIEVILTNTTDAIALAQTNGNIETRNPAFVTLFGEQVAQSIERILWIMSGEDQITAVGQALVQSIHDRESQRVEAQILSNDEGDKDIDLSFIPVLLANEDNQEGILVSAHDITHLKEIERFKTRFVADAVHDLATPMSGLSTRLYLLRRSPEKLNEHLQAMENQVDHLRNLLADLRTLSQLDRGQISYDLQSHNINEIALRVFDTYEPVAISKAQTLSLQIDAELPEVILDGRQIERVFVNLVSNAINYTPDGRNIRVQTVLQEDHILFLVTDEGMGIAPEDLPHIFERFYRTNQARTTQSNGTGLGLAIVKEIVELHGGSVSVDSKLDIGSTFSVCLPRHLKA